MERRTFLKRAALAAGGAALAGCDKQLLNLLNQGEEQLWGMNVHPFEGDLMGAQLEALRDLRIRQVRITLGLHRDLAGPYISRYAAEYTGLLNDFDDPIPSAASWSGLVQQAVRRNPGLFCYEVLNEPMALAPADYVARYLRPAYEIVKAANPASRVAAAAPTGTAGGRAYFYQMTDAGADEYCDFRAAHLYSDNPEVYLKGTRRPFMVTESGIQDPARHVDWYKDKMTHISGVLETDRMHFYVLADRPDNGFGIISSYSRPGNIGILSPLYAFIKGRYGGG
jgi:hypothetical protein